MAVFSIFEPPQSDLDARDHAAKFQFVRDGFSWGAFVFGPLWMLRHRMWLSLFLYVLIVGGLMFAMTRVRLPDGAEAGALFAIAILLGLEAATLRRWKLLRGKWTDHGIVVSDDIETAERRFFDRWFSREASPASSGRPAAPHYPHYALAAHNESHGIIGSFPEPGGGR
jgi:hypothetical protein